MVIKKCILGSVLIVGIIRGDQSCASVPVVLEKEIAPVTAGVTKNKKGVKKEHKRTAERQKRGSKNRLKKTSGAVGCDLSEKNGCVEHRHDGRQSVILGAHEGALGAQEVGGAQRIVQKNQASTASAQQEKKRVIQVSNCITKDMIKYWSYAPDSFVVLVNDIEIGGGQTKPVEIVDDTIHVRYNFSFANGYRKDSRVEDFTCKDKLRDFSKCSLYFSWNDQPKHVRVVFNEAV